MMEMFALTETIIRDNASPESFRRGEDYYQQGFVLSLTSRGDTLQAEVAGSEIAPYEVRVAGDAAGVTEAACGCPYEWGGWCKHIVAALLACVRESEAVEERPALEDTLSELGRDELQSLLLKLAEREPSLADIIEGEVSLRASSGALSVNTEAIRRRVRSSIHNPIYMDPYEGYWRGGGDLDEAYRVLEEVWAMIRADDSRGALPVLEAVTTEYMEHQEMLDWEMIEDYGGELLDLFGELGAAWTEALLQTDLTPYEQEDYSAKLDVWWDELREYDDSFGVALRAVEQGWSYPPLVRVLEGKMPDDEFFEEIHEDPLTIARLNVLDRQGRHQEYLRLAEAAGEATAHTIMLVRMERTEEGVEYGLSRLANPEEALAVAGALRERGELEAALTVGEHGLSLEGYRSSLATWVRDLAEGVGRSELALRAAVEAFRANADLASYQRVRELAGEGWPGYRAELLDHLHRSTSYHPPGHIEVFLHEGLIRDAIAAVEESLFGSMLARVADAAIESHPDWVIETCREKAEGIMDAGSSKYYAEAVDWLAKARDAYLADGRGDEWRAYLDELISRHQRKYKLRPMLEDLGG